MSTDGHAWAPVRPTLRTSGSHQVVIPGPPAWSAEGLCAQIDTELFFPEKGGSSKTAKQICQTCPVVAQCLAYALDRGERYGIWGGRSERERRKLEAARKQQAVAS